MEINNVSMGLIPLQRNPINILRPWSFAFPYPLSHAFFQDAIEEIYNKDASLSKHLKKYIFLCVAYNAIEWGNSGIFRCDVV
jgi:hypothetical protein